MPSDRTQRPRLGQVRRRVTVPAFLQHEHTERDSSAASSSDGVSSSELQFLPQLTQRFAVLTRYVRKSVNHFSYSWQERHISMWSDNMQTKWI